MVAATKTGEVYWFIRRRGKFKDLAPSPDGIIRSEIFPGLWLDAAALSRRDQAHVLATLQQGLASQEHATFVARLAGKRG